MTIQAVYRRTEPIVTVGGEILLGFPFRILAARDLAVQMERGERIYRLVLGYDYVVDGVGAENGGHVRLLRVALAGDKYVIEGARPHERATDIVQQKVLHAKFLNDELDSLQVQIAELRRDIVGLTARLPADLLLPPINTPLPDPHDEYLKKLITGAYEMLGSAGQIGREATEWAQETAEASIRDLLGEIELKTGYTRTLEVRVDAEAALVREVETLTAAIGDNAAAVQSEAEARADADDAEAAARQLLAARVQTAESQLGGVGLQIDAAVQQEAEARASADGALAQQQTVLSAKIGAVPDGSNLHASVTQVAQAQVEQGQQLADVRAFYGIVVQAGGRIGFFKLDGTPAEINAIFGVDKFILVDAQGETKTPFVTGFIDGISTTVLGNLVSDGYIIGRHLDVESVTTEIISAVKAKIDELVAVLIRNEADTLRADFSAHRLYRTDGKMDIDFANRQMTFISG